MTQTQLTRRQFTALTSSTALLGLAGCGTSVTEESPTTDGDTTEPTSAGSQSPTVTEADGTTATEVTDDAAVVRMVTDNNGSYFDPKGIVVVPGTTVRFINESGSHGSTAYHPDADGQPLRIPDAAEPWDSPIYTESDRRFEVTLEVEGVYDYYCPPHESMGMVGRIIVGDPQDGPGTSPPEQLPPGAEESLPSVTELLENGSIAGP